MFPAKFKKALPVLETIEANQHEAYFVGGCVRDLLLERPITDIDIATSALPEEVQDIFSQVIPVGIEHGTVIVRHQKRSYEVTTFRTDGTYSDRRHPDSVEFIRSIEKDLERRDFTINALAMDKEGRIVDLFDGRSDLEKRLIRTVGNGLDRFGEDALRIIRALRFASQLNFQIDDTTYQAMIASKDAILDIATERITNEMERFFAGESVANGLKYFVNARFDTVLPVFKDYPDLVEKLPSNMKPLQTFSEVIAFFHYVYPTISIPTWTKEWKCSNKTKKTALQLAHSIHHYNQNGLDKIGIYQLKEEYFPAFIRLVDILMQDKLTFSTLQELKSNLPIQSRADLGINGTDILHLFPNREGGPWVKVALDKVEKEVVTGNLKNREEEIKEWLVCKQAEIN